MKNYQVIEYQLFSLLACCWLIVDVTKKELTFGASSFICEMFVMVKTHYLNILLVILFTL